MKAEIDLLPKQSVGGYFGLIEMYGEPPFEASEDPLEELIGTTPAARLTIQLNSGRAFAQLKAAFGGDWDAVRTAPLDAIKEAIRPAGMYNQKGPAIVATLEAIRPAALEAGREEYDLRFLADSAPRQRGAGFLNGAAGRGLQNGEHCAALLL